MKRSALLVVLGLLTPMASFATPPPPSKEPIVTTLVREHPGSVGGVVVDRMGYVYLADFLETVWRLDPYERTLTRYLDGLYGASGNAFDKNGNLYQASFYGHYVSRISRSGERSIVADEGLAGPVGLVFTNDGDLLVCNCNDQQIKKIDPSGAVSTFATSDHFNCPNGITRDADGNFYVVSFSDSKVVKVTPEGKTSVFADAGGKGLGHITYLRGIFYATSFWDNKVYRIGPSGQVTVLAGTGERGQRDGKGEEAAFSSPNGIRADPSGSYLYVNDYLGGLRAVGVEGSPFSVRRIELPSLSKVLDYHLTHGSVSDMRSAYHEFTGDPALAGENTEVSVNVLAWSYLRQDKVAEAVALFELNAAAHEDSWRAHSSLGAGYVEAGEREKAIAALERSLELNPDNGIARGRLEALRASDD